MCRYTQIPIYIYIYIVISFVLWFMIQNDISLTDYVGPEKSFEWRVDFNELCLK